jgi:aspartate kinase
MKRIVIKFGGTSVMDTRRIERAAEIALAVAADGYQVVTVVSAMGHTTDHLINLAQDLQANPDPREMDLLLTTGEQVAAALLTMAIQAKGGKAKSFTGAGAGIVTDNEHGNARIKQINTLAVENCLNLGCIPVVAGFQGISDANEITTLGRGGSDTTAIGLAAALRAERCDIYTDVNGIYSADPKLASTAYKLDTVSYDEMLELALNGAQVLNPRSVEIARNRNVPIRVRSTFEPTDRGTLIISQTGQKSFTGIACNAEKDCIRVIFSLPSNANKATSRRIRQKRFARKQFLLCLLSAAGIKSETGNSLKHTAHELLFCVDKAQTNAAMSVLQQALLAGEQLRAETDLVKISIVAAEISSACEVSAILSLTKSSIPITLVTRTTRRLSLFVPKQLREEAISVLHAQHSRLRQAA